jgi:hypothetical protein
MNSTQKKQLQESALHEAYELRFALSEFTTFSSVGDNWFVIDGSKWIKWDSFRQQDILFHLDSWIVRINKIQELIEGLNKDE